MKKFSLIALVVLAVALVATAVYLLIERQSGADGSADNFDDDGDGFCETAPCVGSLNPVFQVNELRGGDCDDNPSDGGAPFTVGSGSGAFKTDGSWGNNPGSADWKGDNYDNDCDGVVDEGGGRIHFQDFAWEDGLPRILDNCPTISNPDQSDMDKDGVGDQCDTDCDGNGVREVLGEFEFPNLNCSSSTQ